MTNKELNTLLREALADVKGAVFADGSTLTTNNLNAGVRQKAGLDIELVKMAVAVLRGRGSVVDE